MTVAVGVPLGALVDVAVLVQNSGCIPRLLLLLFALLFALLLALLLELMLALSYCWNYEDFTVTGMFHAYQDALCSDGLGILDRFLL